MVVKRFIFPIVLFVVMFITVPGVFAQFSFSKSSKAIFSGEVRDAKTDQPISEATITVRTEYGEEKAQTDAAGHFQLKVEDAKGLKNFLLLVSHPDYREKDFSSLVGNSYDGKAKFNVRGKEAKVKYKKTEIILACGDTRTAQPKNGKSRDFHLECENNEHSINFPLTEGNEMTITNAGDVEIELEGQHAKIETAQDELVKLDFKAVMYKR